jgi:acylphosphatase
MADLDETPSRVNLVILGQVQGVFFRASTLEQAQSLRLSGWVKNLADGAVEILAEGSKYALEELISWCRHGPPDAKVEDVIVKWGKFQDEFRTFMISR